MAPKTFNWRMWSKMFAVGTICCIGGPALVIWVTPTEEELFKRYNPDLQKRSLANRVQKQQEFDEFVGRLKEYSKSDKPIWEAAAEAERWEKENKMEQQTALMRQMRERKEEVRRSGREE